MRPWMMSIVSGLFFLCVWNGAVSAADQDDNKTRGANVTVEHRLENRYGVTDARIDSLRKEGLGYGEIDHVFSLAKQMPGGIDDQNIRKIMDLRGTGGHKTGWGKISQELGLKLHPRDNDRDDQLKARHEERVEQSEKSEASEKAEVHAGSSAALDHDEGRTSLSESSHVGLSTAAGLHGMGGGRHGR